MSRRTRRPARAAVLALGSNLGDREATLAAAVRDIADLPGVELIAVSPVYESAAVKLDGVDTDAPGYLNARGRHPLPAATPHALLDARQRASRPTTAGCARNAGATAPSTST